MKQLPVHYDLCTPLQRRAVREEYVLRQEGKCSHCGELLSDPPSEKVKARAINAGLFPPNFFKHPVHLHHSHDTGLTIGAAHARCNAYLWQYLGQ